MDAPTSGGSGTTYGSAPSRSPSSVSVSSAQEDLVRGPTLGERKAGGGSAATSSDSQHSSFEEEDALSAPASPADTSLGNPSLGYPPPLPPRHPPSHIRASRGALSDFSRVHVNFRACTYNCWIRASEGLIGVSPNM